MAQPTSRSLSLSKQLLDESISSEEEQTTDAELRELANQPSLANLKYECFHLALEAQVRHTLTKIASLRVFIEMHAERKPRLFESPEQLLELTRTSDRFQLVTEVLEDTDRKEVDSLVNYANFLFLLRGHMSGVKKLNLVHGAILTFEGTASAHGNETGGGMSVYTAARCLLYHYVFGTKPDQKNSRHSSKEKRRREVYEQFRIAVSGLPQYEAGMEMMYTARLARAEEDDLSPTDDEIVALLDAFLIPAEEPAHKRARVDFSSDDESMASPLTGTTASWTDDDESNVEFAWFAHDLRIEEHAELLLTDDMQSPSPFNTLEMESDIFAEFAHQPAWCFFEPLFYYDC